MSAPAPTTPATTITGEPLGLLSGEKREKLRQRLLAATPRWYSPWAHLSVTSVFGLAVAVFCCTLLDGVKPWEWLILPFNLLLCNALEWHAHANLLHKRSRVAPILYDRHTPTHHMLYVTGSMAIREWRELRQVLIPAYGIMLIALIASPITALFWLLGLPNLGLLYLASAVGYVVLYEWMHCSYHLPANHPLGRSKLVARLRRHHEIHHDPRLMQRWNMNVTVPLWDWVKGTIVKQPATEGLSVAS